MKWVIVTIAETHDLSKKYGFYTESHTGNVAEFEDLDDAYRVKGTLGNATIIPVDSSKGILGHMLQMSRNAVDNITKLTYWVSRAEAAEKLAEFEPSNPDTYAKYLQAKERLDNLKEREKDYV